MVEREDLDLDLTPLSLIEVEEFLFEHKRVPWDSVDYDLKADVEDYLGELFVIFRLDIASHYSKIKYKVDRYNAWHIQRFTHGLFVKKAELGFSLKPNQLELWVDYHGITQERVECLPESIKHGLMDQYLPGWREYVAKEENALVIRLALQNAISGRLKSYIGQNNAAQMRAQMINDVQLAVIKTGLVEKVVVSSHSNILDIQIRPLAGMHTITLTATLG
jgi:hypothetical protein